MIWSLEVDRIDKPQKAAMIPQPHVRLKLKAKHLLLGLLSDSEHLA